MTMKCVKYWWFPFYSIIKNRTLSKRHDSLTLLWAIIRSYRNAL